MGVTRVTSKFLIDAFASGVKFKKSLTIGRQNLFVSPRILEKQLVRTSRWPDGLSKDKFHADLCHYPYYLDALLTLLGADEVVSMDYSNYEGASLIHDMNQPVPADLKAKFDMVFDGGSLEHVFNISVALKNCMEMVKPEGHLILNVVANNYFGHGFYQVSPEFFFRTLNAQNGFRLDRIIVSEYDYVPITVFGQTVMVETSGDSYEVFDPARSGDRVLLMSKQPVSFMVQATRISSVPIFARTPQQSDYEALWASSQEPSIAKPRPVRDWIKQSFSPGLILHFGYSLVPAILGWIKPLVYYKIKRRQSLRNRKSFRRVG